MRPSPPLVCRGGASALGGLTGGLVLLVLPAAIFRAVVPALIALACLLVIAQPRLNRRLARVPVEGAAPRHWALLAGVFGLLGARCGRLLQSRVLRAVNVGIGVLAVAKLLLA